MVYVLEYSETRYHPKLELFICKSVCRGLSKCSTISKKNGVIVASNIDVFKEQIEHGKDGFLVPNLSPHKFAQ